MIAPAVSARILGVLAAGLLGACATAPAGTASPVLESYAKDPFSPVNLYVNANEHVPAGRGEVLDYAAQRLTESGAFLRADRGVQRWMYTLQLRFTEEAPRAGGDFARRVLSVATLGLFPVRLSRIHHLSAEVFLEPEPVGQFRYSEPIGDAVSLWGLADPNADEREAVERLLERMLADFAARKVIPRAREFEPEPAPKKPRRKGQAT